MHKFQIDPPVYILAALLLLTVPLRWLLAAFCAAAIHELSHLAAIYLLGGTVWRLRLGIRGAEIETEPMGTVRDIVAAAAGPAGSLLLLLLAGRLPRVALCAAVQAMYNLLPVLPLDGGRIVNGVLRCVVSPPKAAKISQWISVAVFGGIVLAVWFMHLGLLPLLILLPFVQSQREIFLAKRTN